MEKNAFKKIEEYLYVIEKSPIFAGMGRESILEYLKVSESKIVKHKKDDIIFLQDDLPNCMHILIDGTVAICNDSSNGKRSIIAVFENAGEMFGEVFLFLNHKEYEHYAQALTDSLVLEIPREYFFDNKYGKLEDKARITSNLLGIFAQKTYYLNQRLNILLCGNLRQKLAKIILKGHKNGVMKLYMNREELADFVNTARPSLSRELMSMQTDGLIRVDKRTIQILDFDRLNELL